ncbi:hypothetical protein FRC03_004909 [Tulasnella sp. 419]|nr:hypothetical protein FRC02_010569 [Tulasnella sp. 418]KAG8961842.1 hypothetical protein FRC03_004909 [Tulasnella sp. 419]
MRSSFVLVAFLLAPAAVFASEFDGSSGITPRSAENILHRHRQHAHVVRDGKKALKKRALSKSKRCKAKHTTTSAPAPTQTKESGDANDGSGDVIQIDGGKCNPVGATAKTTKTTGPNGSIDFLNCGIHSGGWTPPKITVKNLIYKSLDNPNVRKTFAPCTKYFDKFEQYAKANGFPSIFLAAFAMQESSCNPGTKGGGGEVGMFQLSPDKCKQGVDCFDVDYNMRTAAEYFKGQLDSSGGNVLEALGSYNGWFEGITEGKARAAAGGPCCLCQNNLDYLHQWTNGWIQGINAYEAGLGKYFNLRVCSGH